MDNSRGVIRNKKFALQVRDFSGLRFGNITPTDIDMLIEYKNKAFIYGETKYKNAEIPYGQELALERLCDVSHDANKPSIAIISSHESEGDIDMAQTVVTKYRFRKKWYLPEQITTMRELVQRFINWVDVEYGHER